ncbi:hypothetical protein KCP76_00270 [Salmonella enterica subsp. enterica serovar Weltevreden]|nr:hypothetical protein KCP76_00270 [Salmonella enterica subsp. enterica serovar Weltevreden]
MLFNSAGRSNRRSRRKSAPSLLSKSLTQCCMSIHTPSSLRRPGFAASSQPSTPLFTVITGFSAPSLLRDTNLCSRRRCIFDALRFAHCQHGKAADALQFSFQPRSFLVAKEIPLNLFPLPRVAGAER